MNKYWFYDWAIKKAEKEKMIYDKKIKKYEEYLDKLNLNLNYLFNSEFYPVTESDKELLAKIASYEATIFNIGINKNRRKRMEKNILIFNFGKKIFDRNISDKEKNIIEREFITDDFLISFYNVIENDFGFLEIPYDFKEPIYHFKKENGMEIFNVLKEKAEQVILKETDPFEKIRLKNNVLLLIEFLDAVLLNNEPIAPTFNKVYQKRKEYFYLLQDYWFVKHDTLYHNKIKLLKK